MTLSAKQKKIILKNHGKTDPPGNFPKWFSIFLILIPILFFVLLETGLRLFSYGRDDAEWIDISPEYQILNPEVSRRYFSNTSSVPFSIESFVKKNKEENSFRIFVLGESSAAGYPYHTSASFSKYLRKALQYAYPDTPLEVVNIGMSAISSYTILDLMPSIIEKKPDLILIYTGHNEYYGALGVGSMQSAGSSGFVVRTLLWLNKFKTIELIKNITASLTGIFKSSNTQSEATLMAQMAREKLIEYNSDLFEKGIGQFENNLDDILADAKNAGIPVILGALVSNYKDQPPFNPAEGDSYPAGDKIFSQAQSYLKGGNIWKADSLFRYAKDLDALRFRAPEEFNYIIKKLSVKYNFSYVPVDSLMNSVSKEGIVGNDLMTDHLHPNVSGYQFIGRFYLEKMKEAGLLPESQNTDWQIDEIDSKVRANYYFTPYDSTVAAFRIKILKSDWPFFPAGRKISREELLGPANFVDSISLRMIDGNLSRESARLILAQHYLKQKRIPRFTDEINALIEEFPFNYKYFNYAAKELIALREIDRAYDFLERGFKKKPDAFSSKWLGIINLSRKNYDRAISFMETSLKYFESDPQIYFNLAGALADKKDYAKALDAINRCVALDPGFPNAFQLMDQLKMISKKNN